MLGNISQGSGSSNDIAQIPHIDQVGEEHETDSSIDATINSEQC